MPLTVAILTTDKREPDKDYANPVPGFGTAPEALLQGMALLPDVEVHIVCCLQQPVRSPEKIAPNIWYHGLHVPKLGWLRTFYQGCIRAVRRKLKEIQPDIVHGQGTERDCSVTAVLSGFRNVVTIHGNMTSMAKIASARFGTYHWWAAWLEDFALQRTAGVFCNSEYTERLVRPRTRRTWRVPNAVRPQFLIPSAETHRPAQCTLVNVGVIAPHKRQLELLDVAQQLHQQGQTFEFQFVGRDDPGTTYTTAFLEKIKPMEAAGYARYIGLKSTSELIDCLDRSAALVHFPSEEAFGLVVAEALARNLKLFGARLGGIPDIADGTPNAELFGPEDWSGLTAAIARWIRNGFPRSPGAAETMRARYHPDVIAHRHLEIYREVLSSAS
jgi:glycosyltransferase involved in cell wall biosynthesis